ncbi:MAG: phosphoglycerate kinase [Patescibacteria group bacterium]|nr:phosphoglycerate kinase [Patescibacteria group bacterium]
MKKLKDFKLEDKRVILRANFDVPFDEKGEIFDDFRIRKALPTIKYLLEQQARVIIISHAGRPSEGTRLSLAPVALRLSKLLDKKVKFIQDCVGRQVERAAKIMSPGDIILLENVRFNSGERSNNEVFAKKLAKLGEIYINDAFSNCHRNHASVVGIASHLPSGAGLLLEEEIKVLSSAVKNPKKPMVLILGGAKIDTKISCLLNFLKIADHILIGGMFAPAILHAKGISLSGVPLKKEVGEIFETIELTNPKLHLPIDALVGLRNHQLDYLRQAAVGQIRKEEQMFDIGPESIRIFSHIIEEANTIIWNGPLGYVEDERFAGSTLAIASSILRTNAFSIVGGGDTNAFLAANNLRSKFSYISTGGGAMLDFLSNKELPGIKVLEK